MNGSSASATPATTPSRRYSIKRRTTKTKRRTTKTERRRANSPLPEQPTILSTSYTYLGIVGSASSGVAVRWRGSGGYPYLSRRAMIAGRLSSRGSKETAHSTSGAGERRLRCNAERVKAGVSGRFELKLAERVVDALADLARDGQPRDGGVAARAGRSVDGDVGRALPVRVHGRLHECPAQVRRAGLGEMATAPRLSRFVDDRVEPGQPRDLLGAAEAACLADLGEQVAGQDRPDPVDRLQRLAALISAGEATQLGVDGVQLRLERTDDREQRVDL